MHCCAGNASRTLYYVWERMLEHTDGVLKLNPAAHRASRWADIDSYIPYQGRVDFHVKQPCRKNPYESPRMDRVGSAELICRKKRRGTTHSLGWQIR